MVNFHEHVTHEFKRIHIDQYFAMGGQLDDLEWRTFRPSQFIDKVSSIVEKRIS
jgi:hypothetical protein